MPKFSKAITTLVTASILKCVITVLIVSSTFVVEVQLLLTQFIRLEIIIQSSVFQKNSNEIVSQLEIIIIAAGFSS